MPAYQTFMMLKERVNCCGHWVYRRSLRTRSRFDHYLSLWLRQHGTAL